MCILDYLNFFRRMATELTDEHLLNLSKRITGEEELMDLGIKVLDLPRRTIQSALSDKKEIQPAAFKILNSWQEKQENAEEAFITLCTLLRKNNMNQLATELNSSFKDSYRIHSALSDNSTYALTILTNHY